jgi:hypothetical protein
VPQVASCESRAWRSGSAIIRRGRSPHHSFGSSPDQLSLRKEHRFVSGQALKKQSRSHRDASVKEQYRKSIGRSPRTPYQPAHFYCAYFQVFERLEFPASQLNNFCISCKSFCILKISKNFCQRFFFNQFQFWSLTDFAPSCRNQFLFTVKVRSKP